VHPVRAFSLVPSKPGATSQSATSAVRALAYVRKSPTAAAAVEFPGPCRFSINALI
jgi:hypothetical protein